MSWSYYFPQKRYFLPSYGPDENLSNGLPQFFNVLLLIMDALNQTLHPKPQNIVNNRKQYLNLKNN
jgi:hypothetical protein